MLSRTISPVCAEEVGPLAYWASSATGPGADAVLEQRNGETRDPSFQAGRVSSPSACHPLGAPVPPGQTRPSSSHLAGHLEATGYLSQARCNWSHLEPGTGDASKMRAHPGSKVPGHRQVQVRESGYAGQWRKEGLVTTHYPPLGTLPAAPRLYPSGSWPLDPARRQNVPSAECRCAR